MSTKTKTGFLLVLLLVLALPGFVGCTAATVQAKPAGQPTQTVDEAPAPTPE